MDDPRIVERLIGQSVRTLQIIIFALVAGIVMFTIFVVCNPPAANLPAPPKNPGFDYFAIGLFAAGLLASMIVPRLIIGAQVPKIADGTWMPRVGASAQPPGFDTDSAKLLAIYATSKIVSAALLEGPAFAATSAFMIGRNPAMLAVVVVAVAILVIMIPTRSRVQQWLERQQHYIDEMRQLAGSRGT